MSKTQKTKPKNPPVAEFKAGAIVAAVSLRTTETGMSYLDFSLERLYENKAGKWQRSKNYFSQNAEAIAQVAQQAKEFIEQHRDNPEEAAEQVTAERVHPAANGFAQESTSQEVA